MGLPIAIVVAFGIGLMISPAHAVSLVIGDADLTAGAMFTGGGTKIKFASTGGSAVFDLDLIANQDYTITVGGQTNASDSFFNFFIDPDGAGGLAEYQLGGNFSFYPGFTTLSLPSFIATGTDFLRITSAGTNNNFSGQIDAVDISINAVPGPIVGAGLPGLVMAIGGLVVLARRRRNQVSIA